MNENPYSLVFGKAPSQLISRIAPYNEIIQSFTADEPSQQVYIITGVRGSGKTVFLTEVADTLRDEDDWIVIELNPNRDLLTSLAAKLVSENSLAQIFRRARINLSFFGFGLEVDNAAPITDIETALSKMLASLDKHGKRVLIEIDEVSNTKTMREFASSFQIFVRDNLPVFLLATGLYQNVRELQNTKNLTFLYRAPKIELAPLNLGAIAANYEKTFGLDHDDALAMANLTKGYSFAFQALGYLTWNAKGDWKSVLGDYRQYLEEYSYEKIWSEFSGKDREVAHAVAESPDGRILGIREKLGMTSNQFNPYRKRLILKGVLNGDMRGYVSFTLPYFSDFVREQYEFAREI
jgi:hypothetical protein